LKPIYKSLKITTMSKGKLVTGILVGAAAGAILGILFAPDKGTETRKKISKKGSDLTDSLKSKYSDFVDAVASKFSSAKDDAEDLLNKGKDKANNMKADVKHALS
jgi:gas vesicle protein